MDSPIKIDVRAEFYLNIHFPRRFAEERWREKAQKTTNKFSKQPSFF